MLGAALLSCLTTPRDIHEANDFSFKPIIEVAILFLGIFATMIPALEWLERYAAQLGVTTASQFLLAWRSPLEHSRQCPDLLEFLSLEIGLL